MQVTIFEGEKLPTWGCDGEDLAICTATLKEIDAVEFMTKLFSAKDQLEGLVIDENGNFKDEISQEEYNSILLGLI